MKTIVIKSQEELDALPDSFQEFTVIEIRATQTIYVKKDYGPSSVVAWGNSSVVAWGNSRVEAWGNSRVEAWGNSSVVAWGNSRVEAWGNSSVEAWGNSRVEAWGNSRVEAWGNSSVVARENSRVVARENSRVVGFLCATIICCSIYVTIKKLLDNSRLIYKNPNCKRPEQVDSTAIITEYEELVSPTFEQWLDRGYVMADGILKKHKKTKQLDDGLTLHEVFNDISERETSFVVTDGNHYSHGKTLRQAVSDLMFKKSERDASKYQGTKLDQVFKTQDAIVMYRTITGACSQGVEEFLEKNFKDKEEVSISEIIKITEGHYGHEQFKNFGWA